jgi:ketosteroid isomerase-like protein
MPEELMTTKTSDESQIQELRDNLTNSLRAKDADAAVSHYAAETVMFILAPPLQYKTGENAPGKQGMKEWFDTFDGALGYEVRELAITTSGDVAFCHSLNHMTGTKTNGENVDLWLRETLGLCRMGGAWKITHQHESVPFYMDGSNRAAVDLKP